MKELAPILPKDIAISPIADPITHKLLLGKGAHKNHEDNKTQIPYPFPPTLTHPMIPNQMGNVSKNTGNIKPTKQESYAEESKFNILSNSSDLASFIKSPQLQQNMQKTQEKYYKVVRPILLSSNKENDKEDINEAPYIGEIISSKSEKVSDFPYT